MTDKTKTVLLALVTGSSGSSAQFSGRKNLGWGILISCWVVLPAIIWVWKTRISVNQAMPVMLFYAIVIFSHVVLAIYHGVSKSVDQTMEMVRSRNSRVLLSIMAAVMLAWAADRFAFSEQVIDTSRAVPVSEFRSVELSDLFNQDESAFRKEFDRKVVMVTGKVVSIGEDFSEGSYIALEASAGSPTDLNCYFLPERQAEFTNIANGQVVTVTGVVDGRFLRNCYLNKP